MPVAHSLSPKIFGLLAERLKRQVDYSPLAVAPGNLVQEIARLRDEGYVGLNVTIPHKQSMLALVDSLTPQAKAMGAVNVVRFSPRHVKGHNTDAEGFADAIEALRLRMAGEDAVIFGAGGAARAVGYALGAGQARQVRICARTPAKAQELARTLARLFPKTIFTAGPAARAFFWVNATPLGMAGFPQLSPAPEPMECRLAFDLVYARNTPFLVRARASGAAACDGLSMLVHQAVRSWEFLFGGLNAIPRNLLASTVLRSLCAS